MNVSHFTSHSTYLRSIPGFSYIVRRGVSVLEGGRMAVVKLSDGSLWVHSPVELDGPLRKALDKVGPVMHIVSPNYEHVK